MQSIKRNVIYGPIYLQGMGIKKNTVVGATHILLLVQFYSTDANLGRLLQTSLECLVMGLFLSGFPFSYDYGKYSACSTRYWMTHLWKFCYDRGVILRRTIKYFRGRRLNDKNIMQCFINNGYHSMQLASINRCQVYLKVIHLLEIMTGDRYCISKLCYYGRHTKYVTT